jgi:hypothetical protein
VICSPVSFKWCTKPILCRRFMHNLAMYKVKMEVLYDVWTYNFKLFIVSFNNTSLPFNWRNVVCDWAILSLILCWPITKKILYLNFFNRDWLCKHLFS